MSPAAIPATVRIGTVSDMAPLVEKTLRDVAALGGGAPELTAEALEAARARFAEELDQTFAAGAAEVEQSMQRTLPKGVKLLPLEASREGLVVTSVTTFEVDDLRVLPILQMAFEQGQPRRRPFEAFTVTVEDGAVTIEGMPPPMALEGPEDELRAQALRLALEVEVPVLESNATSSRRAGDRTHLEWRFDGAQLRARIAADRGWVQARFRM